jgi:hypothetical protein
MQRVAAKEMVQERADAGRADCRTSRKMLRFGWPDSSVLHGLFLLSSCVRRYPPSPRNSFQCHCIRRMRMYSGVISISIMWYVFANVNFINVKIKDPHDTFCHFRLRDRENPIASSTEIGRESLREWFFVSAAAGFRLEPYWVKTSFLFNNPLKNPGVIIKRYRVILLT